MDYLHIQKAKIMDPILPVLRTLGYWAIILGSFAGPGTSVLGILGVPLGGRWGG